MDFNPVLLFRLETVLARAISTTSLVHGDFFHSETSWIESEEIAPGIVRMKPCGFTEHANLGRLTTSFFSVTLHYSLQHFRMENKREIHLFLSLPEHGYFIHSAMQEGFTVRQQTDTFIWLGLQFAMQPAIPVATLITSDAGVHDMTLPSVLGGVSMTYMIELQGAPPFTCIDYGMVLFRRVLPNLIRYESFGSNCLVTYGNADGIVNIILRGFDLQAGLEFFLTSCFEVTLHLTVSRNLHLTMRQVHLFLALPQHQALVQPAVQEGFLIVSHTNFAVWLRFAS